MIQTEGYIVISVDFLAKNYNLRLVHEEPQREPRLKDIVQNNPFSLKECQVHSEASGEEGVLSA